MRLPISHRNLAIAALAAMALVLPQAAAQAHQDTPSATITANQGQDYAATELGNPWDMDSTRDIAYEYTRDNGQISNLRFEGGKLKGTTGGDARVTILVPSHSNINPLPPEGGYRPINSSFYKYLTVKMSVSKTAYAMVFWQNSNGSSYESTGFTQFNQGDSTMTIDLSAGGANSIGNWDGSIQGLYFDPAPSSGIDFEIDYIRLSNAPPSEPANTPPTLHITAPSYISGPDYASSVLGDPWDMSNSGDVTASRVLGATSFSNGEFIAQGQTDNNDCGGGLVCGDPQVTLHVGAPINTAKFKYVTYRMKLDGQIDTVNGSISRFVWWSTKPEQSTETEAWVVYEGYQTVSGDLTKLLLLPSAYQTWAQSSPIVFRFDPHEFAAAHQFALDYVMLTGDDQAKVNASYNIRYQASDADGNSLSTTFFYYPAGQADNRQQISCASTAAVPQASANQVFIPLINNGAAPPVLPSGSSCQWNTTGVAAGTYYIVGVVSDGIDTVTTTSQTAVVLN